MATLDSLVVFVVVGLFGTNAIPHFVQGITGKRHMTPFGSDSSAVLNVLWGSVNAAIAGALAWLFRDAISGATLAAAFLAGVALAVGLASFWSAENPRLPWESAD
ncbi:hypothetical protein [Halobellus sp. H-GB7]|uniref:hypothetical protein n=1 Tax=Halobellus sp. H-GB7 TaxID=3069756 RepID=UPI0027B72CB6|nr:hypothetical protein [Halobellus sp. H-GB7]MDQ2054570.1 hypothetical protein [Halobellus sp. H-GB7]